MTHSNKFPPEITEILGHYVYLFVNPLNGEPFYVGKGFGNRAFEHLFESRESEKTNTISEFKRQGEEPKIELLRYGLTERESALIEASIIDLIMGVRRNSRVLDRGVVRKRCGRNE